MKTLVIYLLLLKATGTSFTGLASLPVVRHDFVVHRKLLSDRQLAASVAAGQATPGPLGLYVVGVGYFAGGIPGACAGCLALVTPAFLILPLLRFVATRASSPRVRSVVEALMLAAGGLIVSAIFPLARTALTGPVPVAIAAGSFLFLITARRDTLWVIAGSALAALGAKCAGFSRL